MARTRAAAPELGVRAPSLPGGRFALRGPVDASLRALAAPVLPSAGCDSAAGGPVPAGSPGELELAFCTFCTFCTFCALGAEASARADIAWKSAQFFNGRPRATYIAAPPNLTVGKNINTLFPVGHFNFFFNRTHRFRYILYRTGSALCMLRYCIMYSIYDLQILNTFIL